MWSNYSKRLLQGWGKTLREKLQMPKGEALRLLESDNPTIPKAKATTLSSSVAPKAHPFPLGRGTFYSWKETLKSSPYSASAKAFASKLRASSSEYISKEASKRMQVPTDFAASTKASLKQITQPSQQALQKSVEIASSQLANTASQIVQAGSDSIAKPAQKVMLSSSEQLSKSVASASAAVSTTASQVAQSTKETIISEFRVMRQEALWWLWWWSLAAIAVYGLATTLPGELLREYHRRRGLDNKRRIEADKTVDAAKQTTEHRDNYTSEKTTTNCITPSRWAALAKTSNKEGGSSIGSTIRSWTSSIRWPVNSNQEADDSPSSSFLLRWPKWKNEEEEKQDNASSFSIWGRATVRSDDKHASSKDSSSMWNWDQGSK
jgi:hypothetical protein